MTRRATPATQIAAPKQCLGPYFALKNSQDSSMTPASTQHDTQHSLMHHSSW